MLHRAQRSSLIGSGAALTGQVRLDLRAQPFKLGDGGGKGGDLFMCPLAQALELADLVIKIESTVCRAAWRHGVRSTHHRAVGKPADRARSTLGRYATHVAGMSLWETFARGVCADISIVDG